MSYTKQTWDTTSYVNPTRMNHIEDGIKENSDSINSPVFTEAATRANINSGESLFTILGKIKKFFTDLKAVAFSGSASDVVMSDGVTSVQDALNYSTDEHIVGKWVDGSILYEKTIGLGQLPNNTSVSYSLGISSSYKIIEVKGLMASGRYVEQLETYYGGNNTFSHWYLEDNNFIFTCNTDFSLWNATVTVRYVKTQ